MFYYNNGNRNADGKYFLCADSYNLDLGTFPALPTSLVCPTWIVDYSAPYDKAVIRTPCYATNTWYSSTNNSKVTFVAPGGIGTYYDKNIMSYGMQDLKFKVDNNILKWVTGETKRKKVD
jgi:hypothetical protein